MFKHYGLAGQTVRVRTKRLAETTENPWAYAEQKMKIVGEYPNFLVATVLPHRNPKGFGNSHPYSTTIHKHDIQCGEVLINGGAIV